MLKLVIGHISHFVVCRCCIHGVYLRIRKKILVLQLRVMIIEMVIHFVFLLILTKKKKT